MTVNSLALLVGLVALGLLLFRELGPSHLSLGVRVGLDMAIVLLVALLFYLVLSLDGLIHM